MDRFLAGCKKSERILALIEDVLLVALLFATMLIACAQIFLRNGGLSWAPELSWSTGLSWADPALKMLVLYLTIMGAVVATRENKHLNIDVLSKFLPDTINRHIQRFTHAFSALICLFMAFYSVKLLELSLEFKDVAFNGIPTWILQLIMPIGFFLMALRFVFNIFLTDISPDADFGVPAEEL